MTAYLAARPCRAPGVIIAPECEIVACALVLRASYKAARARRLKTFRAHFGTSLVIALVLVSAAFGFLAFFWFGVLFAHGRCEL